MQVPLLYGVENTIRFPVVLAGASGHAGSADWTPAAGDLKICQDDTGPADTTNLPTESPAGSYDWKLVLTAAECTGRLINVRIADVALTDQRLDFFTHGHASAAVVRNLNIVDVTHWGGTAIATPDTAGYPKVTIKAGTGAGELNLDSGIVDANLAKILTDAAVVTTFLRALQAEFVGTVTGATSTTTLIDSSLSQSATNHWANRRVIFVTGAAAGQTGAITGFVPATDQLVFSAVPTAPSAGDVYLIV